MQAAIESAAQVKIDFGRVRLERMRETATQLIASCGR
jgi:hypothetical protein